MMTNDPRYTSCCAGETGIMQTIARQLQETLKMLERKPGCKEIREKLNGTLDLVNSIESYSASRSTPLSGFVQKIMEQIREMDFEGLYKKGKVRYNYATNNEYLNMSSPPGQVQFLQFLIRRFGAKKVLEVGTYMGFAAFGMIEAMEPGGVVTGIDIEPLFCDFVNELAEERGIAVGVIYGDALAVLKSLSAEGDRYDLIYIDCVKHENHEYYKLIMNHGLLEPGGLIVCNSTLLGGQSVYGATDTGKALDDFNKLVSDDKRVSSVVLPCFDGLMLIQNAVCEECASPSHGEELEKGSPIRNCQTINIGDGTPAEEGATSG